MGWAKKARRGQTDLHLVPLVVPETARGRPDQHDLQALTPPVALFPLVSPVSRSLFVKAWNPGAYPAEDFIWDRADPASHFIGPD